MAADIKNTTSGTLYHIPYRDAIQTLTGVNASAKEAVDAAPNLHRIGPFAIQTVGGATSDLAARKGRDEWAEADTYTSHFGQHNVKQTGLFRGLFLLAYEANAHDVEVATVMEHARMGLNIIQNFNGANDIRALVGLPEAARIAREEEGHDIIVKGTICVEDNPNVTLDGCLKFAEELIESGHEGFYLKSASGFLRPDFVYELTSKLLDRFDQDIGIHVHSTYGRAPACYLAAIEAATELKLSMEVDVQHPALAGSTGQPSILKIQSLINSHPNQAVRDSAPDLNINAIKADMDSLMALRFRYREFESDYQHALLKAMAEVRAAGGATSTLKSFDGLEANLGRILETNGDWTKTQIGIYNRQKQVDKDLGFPTQVTPYANNTTSQAGISLMNEDMGRDPYEPLFSGTANYLVGRHGKVSEFVNPELVKKALEQQGLKEPVKFKRSIDRAPALPAARQALIAAGVESPITRQAISTVMHDAPDFNALEHVVQVHNGENTPQPPPELPFWAQEPAASDERHIRKSGEPCWDTRDLVSAVGGVPALQALAERVLHLRQLDDGLYEFPEGTEKLRGQWRAGNLDKIDQFYQSIPEKIAQIGSKSGLSASWVEKELEQVLRDVCNAKGEGLYEYMKQALDVTRKKRAVALERSEKQADSAMDLTKG